MLGLLTACGGGGGQSTPNPDQLNGAQLKGTLPAWPYGAMTPQLYTYGEESLKLMTGSTVSQTGEVSVTLPASPAQPFDLLGGCTFNGTRSVTSIKTDLADVLLFTGPDELLGQVTYVRNSDGFPLTHMYANQAATFNGTAICGSNTLKLNLTLHAGWNMVAAFNESGILNLASVTDPASVTLKLVKAQESVTLSTTDNSSLTLSPQKTETRAITFKQTGGIVGPVTLSTNIPGVVVTPSTITFSSTPGQALQAQAATPALRALSRLTGQAQLQAQALTTNVTFSLNDKATSTLGSEGLELKASQNGVELGKTSFAVSITAPHVKASFQEYLRLSAYRATSTNFAVTLEPADGFSGPVTVSLTDLPEGVTAAPKTVTILPNASTSLNIPVTVSSTASLGSFNVTFQGSKVAPVTLNLLVKPARTLVSERNMSSEALRPAANGVWVGQSSYSDGKQKLTLRRYAGGSQQAEVTFPDAAEKTIPVPDGSLYVLGALNNEKKTTTLYRVKDDGTFTTFTVNSLFTATGGVADAQGRIWSFVTDNSQIGTLPYHLAYWDPATNKIINASDVKGNNYLSEALRISNSGRYILYTGTYDSAPALVDSVNVTTRTIGTSGSVFSRSAVSDTGEVWFLSNSGITRVNQDGTSNTFTLPNDIYSEMIGFDKQNAQTLWLRGYGNIYQFNTATFTATTIPTDTLTAAATPKTGGVAMLTSDYNGGAGGKTWLSILP
ncbi:hypothetical protein D3875_19220 [Deinococcus cavernae]|uniref:Uncharacterized protein n=1 Tax=Deinococcus cavernae TaxID=2320857 RepID=A0A418VB57_9DEIO|nr:hypothetical protein D3875_19220 [Deinococcus cavernae]